MEICKKNMCTGCTACSSICPKRCITMKPNEEGFLYPYINEDKCIGCNQCVKVCPINELKIPQFNIYGKIIQIKDKKTLKNCTSGGAFTSIAIKFLEMGGVAIGAVYDDELKIVHEVIFEETNVKKLSGSKYVQSDMQDIYRSVKQLDSKGIKCVFCGTPCQTAGLYNYLGEKRKNVYLIDLVCHGVPSPLLWKKYIEHQEQKYGKMVFANFRSKVYGYHVATMETIFENHKKVRGSARTDLMSKCFFKNIADRESCYNCKFKTIERCSDLTIFDSWHASELNSSLKDDDSGFTNVLVQSNKGKELLKLIQDTTVQVDMDYKLAIQMDGSMAIGSVKRPAERSVFYNELNNKEIDDVVKSICPIRKSDYVIEKLKLPAKKLGLAYYIKRLKMQR